MSDSPPPLERLPRWLTGDWTPLVRDPVDLMRISLLAGAAVTLAIGPRNQSFRMLLTFGLTLIPRALDAPRPFDFAFGLAMGFQAWGNVFGAFDTLPHYDKLVHFVLPASTAALMYLGLVRFRVIPELEDESRVHQRLGIMLLCVAFGLTLGGGLYELYEWFADNVLGAHLYVSYGDSIGDLTDDMLGSLAGAVLILAWDASGWGHRRRRRPLGRRAAADPIARGGARIVERVEPRAPARPPRTAAPDERARSPFPRDLLDLARLTFVAGAVAAAVAGEPENAVRFLLTFAAVMAVRRLELPRLFDAAFVAAMTVQAWGALLGTFGRVGGYDGAVHIIVSASAAPVLYLVAVRLRVLPDLALEPRLHRAAGIALVGFSLGFSVGVLHELYVYVADHVLGADFGVDYRTFVERLAVDAAGAAGGAAVLVGWSMLGWFTRRRSSDSTRGAQAALP